MIRSSNCEISAWRRKCERVVKRVRERAHLEAKGFCRGRHFDGSKVSEKIVSGEKDDAEKHQTDQKGVLDL